MAKPKKSKKITTNIQFLDGLSAAMAHDWVGGNDVLVLRQLQSLNPVDAAYLAVMVFGVLGEAVKDGCATKKQQDEFLNALGRAAS